MKTIGLIFALLLLVFGTAFLIFISFLSLAFSWQDLLFYLVIALIIYFIIRAVGGSLDKKFNDSVKDFLENKSKNLFNDRRLLRTFGLVLITLLPFLVYLFLFALYSAITFSLYGLSLLFSAERIPIAILIGLVIVVLGTVIAIFTGFYYLFFPPKRKTLGVYVKSDDQRKLWEITREIAKEVKAEPISKIIIAPDPGIGVYLDGSLFTTIFGGGERVLEIGLPSLHGLTTGEFKAILAHEYGHFSNRDTQWNSFTYSMSSSLTSALESVPGPPKNGKEEMSLVSLIMSLNPAYWILFLFVRLYFKVTNGFSRIREVMADIMAMNLYGGKAFSSGLLKVATNDLVFNEVIEANLVPRFLKEEKMITDFSKFMEFAHKKLPIKKLKLDILSTSDSHNVYDSHPALKVRTDYAKRFETLKEKDDRPVSALFDNWDDMNKKVAEIYNLRLMSYLKRLDQIEKEKDDYL